VYAVILSGGKQQRVETGQTVRLELLEAAEGEQVQLRPVLLVDGDQVLAGADRLAGASVSGVVKSQVKGPKVRGFTYKPKTRGRRAWGHRQRYSVVEITSISKEA